MPALDRADAIANFDLDTDPANPQIVLAGSEDRDWASRALVNVNVGRDPPRHSADVDAIGTSRRFAQLRT